MKIERKEKLRLPGREQRKRLRGGEMKGLLGIWRKMKILRLLN
jgi:hypothetical protein